MNWSDIPILETLAEELRPLLPRHIINTGTDLLVITNMEQDALDHSPKGMIQLLVVAPAIVRLDVETGILEFSYLTKGKVGSYMLPHLYDLADPVSLDRITTDILEFLNGSRGTES